MYLPNPATCFRVEGKVASCSHGHLQYLTVSLRAHAFPTVSEEHLLEETYAPVVGGCLPLPLALLKRSVSSDVVFGIVASSLSVCVPYRSEVRIS